MGRLARALGVDKHKTFTMGSRSRFHRMPQLLRSSNESDGVDGFELILDFGS